MNEMLHGWWDSLNFGLQVFYGIAIISLASLAIQIVLSLFMGMDDGLGDIGHADHSSGLSIFSIRGVTAFFLGFGWTGVICTKAGMGLPLTLVLAVVVGGVLMLAIFLLMLSFLRMQSSGTLNYDNAVGQTGTVYVTIPPARKSGGQVETMIQGRLVTAEALQTGDEALAPGTKVRIIGKIGSSTLIVEALN
jgi:membrane protein implicated in regulation of membrane protease activity